MASERIEAKRAALRFKIIEVALKAFGARGFEATTTIEIADQLQMTGPALYHYFGTKDELLFACLEHTLEQQVAEVAGVIGGDEPPEQRLDNLVRRQVTFELRQGSAASLINAHLYGPQYLTRMLSTERREALRMKQRTLVHLYRGLIAEGVASGAFADCNVAIAAFDVLALIQYTGVWYRPRKGRSARDVVEAQVLAARRLLGAPPDPSSAKPDTLNPGVRADPV
jgi:AcrR family transcriptional regulator